MQYSFIQYVAMLMCLSVVTSAPTITGKYATYDLESQGVQKSRPSKPPIQQKSLTDMTGLSHQPKAEDVADDEF